jgi:hypothetical protein
VKYAGLIGIAFLFLLIFRKQIHSALVSRACYGGLSVRAFHDRHFKMGAGHSFTSRYALALCGALLRSFFSKKDSCEAAQGPKPLLMNRCAAIYGKAQRFIYVRPA